MITILIVLAALAVAGFLIFSGNSGYSSDQTQNQAPGNNSQAGTQPETGGTGSQTQPQTYNIEIRGYAFNPSTLTINIGDTVTWTNKDSTQHTVTSDSGNEISSSYLSNGGSYSHTFSQAGTFSYHCRPHSYMKGMVIVE